MEEIKITKDNFKEEILDKNDLVLAEFYSNFCVPCKMLSGILDKVEESESANVKIVRYEIDENTELAKSCGVLSVPTMVIYKNGVEAEKINGFRNYNVLVETLKKYY